MFRATPSLRPARLAAIGAAALLTAGIGVATAPAASAAPTAPGGWARVAHLSPDTKSVDVQLTALAGGAVVYELDDVAYGAVSPYIPLADGTYVVSMVPSDAADGTQPVVQQSIDIAEGEPLTVAAYGRNADLKTTVFEDDLSAPAAGQARVRVVQASTVEPTVDVDTAQGRPIARDVPAGSATDYAAVPAGSWDLELTGADESATSAVDLPAGSVSTLFVLDDAQGALTAQTITDSATLADMPVGGIHTGGGGTAAATTAPTGAAATGAGAVAVALGAVALIAARRRRRGEARA
ncbi:protein of unknown function (DUF4397) [Microbacterium hydrothermale]|uniref:DUF4397 domain-containing protein n=1 Tax=Microbacterium hydrothermale TaxID=857427 RepID=UPI002226324C|nr:DUF4397 domain-containing protein [Microbacterium hydrothermale]MCW2166086.1 protein of unknown function (DUF4397) [Microbacterium hydrothermale]